MRLITPWPLLKEIRGRRQPRLAKVPEGRHHVHRRRRLIIGQLRAQGW